MDISVWWLAFLLNYNFRKVCIRFFGMGIDVSFLASTIGCKCNLFSTLPNINYVDI